MAQVAANEPVPIWLLRRESFSRDARAWLKGTVRAEDLDRHLARYYTKSDGSGPLLIDFSEAEYIDISVLPNCIALMLQRKEEGHVTYIAYPRTHKKVRDFLQVWRFPEAVEQATRVRFRDFLLPEDHEYLEEEQQGYTGRGNGLSKLEFNPDWTEQSQFNRNFFEFLTFRTKDGGRISPVDSAANAPRTISQKWTSPLIAQVLAKHLGGNSPKDDVARVVIYESMGNAVRHPKATVIQVVSKFERAEPNVGESGATQTEDKIAADNMPEAPAGALRICVWDDGEGIAQTLQAVIDKGGSVHAFQLPEFMYDKVFVSTRKFPDIRVKEYTVDQSETLTKKNVTEARALLSSLFPGVSRAASESVPSIEPYCIPESQGAVPSYLSALPGMGLYSLLRTVLDQFQGHLVIRSGRYLLKIELAHDAFRVLHQVRYKCKIVQYPMSMPSFRGNLLVIQIPPKPS